VRSSEDLKHQDCIKATEKVSSSTTNALVVSILSSCITSVRGLGFFREGEQKWRQRRTGFGGSDMNSDRPAR
jgi:hypothetical protein